MYLQNYGTEKLIQIPGGRKFMMESRTNIIAPYHHKGGMLRFMWFIFAEGGRSFGKKLRRKIESKEFTDLNHSFGVEIQEPKVEPMMSTFQTEIFGIKLMNWLVITLILGLVIQGFS